MSRQISLHLPARLHFQLNKQDVNSPCTSEKTGYNVAMYSWRAYMHHPRTTENWPSISVRRTSKVGKDLGSWWSNDYAGFKVQTVKPGIVLDIMHRRPCSRQARQRLTTSIRKDLGLYTQDDWLYGKKPRGEPQTDISNMQPMRKGVEGRNASPRYAILQGNSCSRNLAALHR